MGKSSSTSFSYAGTSDVGSANRGNGAAATTTIQAVLPASDAAEFAIIELADREIWVSEAQTTRQGDALTVSVSLEHVGGHGFTFDPATLRLTLLTGPTALDLTGCD